jgi:hypothetical protein
MFRPITSQMSKAIKHFPKMSSNCWHDPNMSNVPLISWSQTPYNPHKLTTPISSSSDTILSPPPPSSPRIPINPSTNKSRIESYDQWFERRLNDKTDDMFLL